MPEADTSLLNGVITEVDRGRVNAEVQVTLDHGEELAVIVSRQDCDRLDLQPGGQSAEVFTVPHFVLHMAPNELLKGEESNG